MNFRVKFKWKLIFRTASPETVEHLTNGLLFNPRGARTFVRSIGGRIRTAYEPVTLDPTDIFHRSLAGVRRSLGVVEKKFPYKFKLSASHNFGELNVAFRLFGQFVSMTLDFESVDVKSIDELTVLKRIDNNSNLAELVRLMMGILASGDKSASPVSSLPTVYAAVQIVSLTDDSELDEPTLVALLTNHPLVRSAVVQSVINKGAVSKTKCNTLSCRVPPCPELIPI